MTLRTPAFVLLVAVAGLAVGCSSPEDKGSSTPPGQPANSSGQESGAPKVTNPIDVTNFAKKPCSFLTSSDSTALGLEATGTADKSACDWTAGSQPGTSVGIGVISHNLSAEYQKQKTIKFYSYFTPTIVDGYPAVISDVADSRPQGRYAMTIGINDHQLLSVIGTDTQNVKDGKTMMLKAASAALKTVKKGA